MSDPSTLERRRRAEAWFGELRDRLCAAFEGLEDALTGGSPPTRPPGRFERRAWRRPDAGDPAAPAEPGALGDGGGGVMALMRGRVFEKIGVNLSTVHGTLAPEFRANIPGAGEDGGFWACGISVVAHLHSPHVPAAHMNTRHIATTRAWFGGGADLTPLVTDADDVAHFQGALGGACDAFAPDAHARYKAWCERYFHLPHRDEPRGAGGIFFDDLDSGDWEADFAFVQNVGRAFLDAYPAIVARHMNRPWTAAEREALLIKRGRYVEFNLLYDRGTLFGLKTGGNPEAVLMSLPPEARWP